MGAGGPREPRGPLPRRARALSGRRVHHRRGIGTTLLEAAAAWAATTPARTLTLTTFRHVPWNAPFYAGRGFAELPAAELGPELRAQVEDEARRGLDPAKRVAMRLHLGTTPARTRTPFRDADR